ncbi:FAD-dependent oxidoreductase [Tabrizicola sp.]|uniref:NAD(P)/FAD-dependent oxidoreductase n=1 Tax=Tabrizicola sp. TaxID=2005166 RepID=UPI0026087065|nr:FAD-dependent oxidoreductase [Tabrizicola sp.]MDM7933053.1 FAD-dependent oxidoreductase [Tabrizicola sp.]
MFTRERTEIAVIGAGVVGLTIALDLLEAGHEVVLVDPAPPGMGASYGNAGTIAGYAVSPVGTPDVLRSLPSLMFSRTSPLAIRHRALPSLMPWLVRFLRQSLPRAADHNAQAIAALLTDAGERWDDLALRVAGAGILQRRGCLYLYETPAAFAKAGAEMATRRALGVEVDLIGPDQLAELEPGLPAGMGGAAFFTGATFLDDPGRMMGLIAAAVLPKARLLQARAEKITRGLDGVVVEGPGLHLHARRVIIAAGAHSRALARSAGDRIPLDTERGYHVEWDMAEPLLQRPTSPTARGFYFCPMAGRLRVAGTVELGGLHLPPSPHRVQKLVDGARAFFPGLGEPDRNWMGFRPSLPDSLPVIGPSTGGAEVIHAFGHGHLGVTMAPMTARIVADLVAGRAPGIDITAYRPGRF